jgi:methionine synthase II (cobalamin-independent)
MYGPAVPALSCALPETQRGLTTMRSHNPPPFRAEHIGSLLRPSKLLDQRTKFARGEIDRTELTKAEDEAIKDALGLQERAGLKLATDGEFRRRSYHSFFYRQLGEISIDTVGGEDAKGGEPGRRAAQPLALINSRVRWTRPINGRISSSSARTAGSFRRSPFQAPVPSTFAAATGRF